MWTNLEMPLIIIRVYVPCEDLNYTVKLHELVLSAAFAKSIIAVANSDRDLSISYNIGENKS
jgi:hypothetical protein